MLALAKRLGGIDPAAHKGVGYSLRDEWTIDAQPFATEETCAAGWWLVRREPARRDAQPHLSGAGRALARPATRPGAPAPPERGRDRLRHAPLAARARRAPARAGRGTGRARAEPRPGLRRARRVRREGPRRHRLLARRPLRHARRLRAAIDGAMYFVTTKRPGYALFCMTPSERAAIAVTDDQRRVHLLERTRHRVASRAGLARRGTLAHRHHDAPRRRGRAGDGRRAGAAHPRRRAMNVAAHLRPELIRRRAALVVVRRDGGRPRAGARGGRRAAGGERGRRRPRGQRARGARVDRVARHPRRRPPRPARDAARRPRSGSPSPAAASTRRCRRSSIHIVALVLSPASANTDHLNVLASMATLLRSAELRAALLAARDGREAFGLLVERA